MKNVNVRTVIIALLLIFVILRIISAVLKYSGSQVDASTFRNLDIGVVTVSMLMLLLLAYGLFTGKLRMPSIRRRR